MATNQPSGLVVKSTKMSQFHTMVIAGYGTPGSRIAVRTARALAGYGVDNEVLDVPFFDWNSEIKNLAHLLPGSMHHIEPKRGIPGLPHGFRDDPELCERTRQHWEPYIHTTWGEVARRSATKGLSCGAVIHILTPAGGHLPVTYVSVRAAMAAFPEALHLGIYFMPSDDKSLWPNLRSYEGYPDNLGIPLVMMDNKHRQRIDQAIPALLATLVAGHRLTDKGQRTYAESFAHVARISHLVAVAEAETKLPIVPIPLYKRLFVAPGVAEQEVSTKVADLLANVLRPPALLLDCDPPESSQVQFVGLGGMPLRQRGERWLETRETFRNDVKRLARDNLAATGEEIPSGLTITWSSTCDVTPRRFARVPAARVFPLPGKTARDFIEEMLASGQSSPDGVAQASLFQFR